MLEVPPRIDLARREALLRPVAIIRWPRAPKEPGVSFMRPAWDDPQANKARTRDPVVMVMVMVIIAASCK